jgi:hypothetical protein
VTAAWARRALGALCVLLTCPVARAQAPGPDAAAAGAVPGSPTQEPTASGWGIFLEQDSVLSPKTDKDYTMGVQFQFSGWRIRRSLFGDVLGGPQRGLDRLLWFVNKGHQRACEAFSAKKDLAPLCKTAGAQRGYQAHELSFGVTAFTPRKGDPATEGPGCEHYGCVLASTEPVYDDRPYASLLYFTYRRSTALGRFGVSSDFTFGMLGLQIAKVVQTAIHDDETDPGGWKYQISNGGEPTANYSFRFKWLAAASLAHGGATEVDWAGADPGDPEDDRRADLTFDGGVSLGMYTNASAGVRARLGRIDSPYWARDRQPVVFTKRPAGAAPHAIREAFVWASFGYELWAYNALLQGQFRSSPVTLEFHPAPTDPNVASPLNRNVWNIAAGATLRLRCCAFSYQYSGYSPLFEGPHSRRHAYWGIYVAFPNKDLQP